MRVEGHCRRAPCCGLDPRVLCNYLPDYRTIDHPIKRANVTISVTSYTPIPGMTRHGIIGLNLFCLTIMVYTSKGSVCVAITVVWTV